MTTSTKNQTRIPIVPPREQTRRGFVKLGLSGMFMAMKKFGDWAQWKDYDDYRNNRNRPPADLGKKDPTEAELKLLINKSKKNANQQILNHQ